MNNETTHIKQGTVPVLPRFDSNLFRSMLKERGFTVETFCERMNEVLQMTGEKTTVSTAAIYSWQNGSKKPSDVMISGLTWTLGLAHEGKLKTRRVAN